MIERMPRCANVFLLTPARPDVRWQRLPTDDKSSAANGALRRSVKARSVPAAI
jgi:hypothetical protein